MDLNNSCLFDSANDEYKSDSDVELANKITLLAEQVQEANTWSFLYL